MHADLPGDTLISTVRLKRSRQLFIAMPAVVDRRRAGIANISHSSIRYSFHRRQRQTLTLGGPNKNCNLVVRSWVSWNHRGFFGRKFFSAKGNSNPFSEFHVTSASFITSPEMPQPQWQLIRLWLSCVLVNISALYSASNVASFMADCKTITLAYHLMPYIHDCGRKPEVLITSLLFPIITDRNAVPKAEMGLQSWPHVHDLNRQRTTPSSAEHPTWRTITGSADELSYFTSWCCCS